MQCRFVLLAASQYDQIVAEDEAETQEYQRLSRELQEAGNDYAARERLIHEMSVLRDSRPNNVTTARRWLALQSMAVSAANLSKLLWGSQDRRKPNREAERAPLRKLLRVDDSSCLRSTKLRNAFEHFDEALEERGRRQPYIGRNIGSFPPGMIAGDDPDERFGHFDPSTSVLSFWERSMNIREVIEEAGRILVLAED
jgi:hypothetical protein